MHVADYIITDYSAIVFEAAITKKPIYFYAFDYNTYMDERGTYINYKEEMPGPICENFKDIVMMIENNVYNKQKEISFCNKYIENLKENATKKIVKFIMKNINTKKYK